MGRENILIWAGGSTFAYRGYPIHLTQRQRDVLLLLCEGFSNKLISRRLCVSDATVKTHVASVLRSLNASTRLEAVTLAFKLGIVRSVDPLAMCSGDRERTSTSHGQPVVVSHAI